MNPLAVLIALLGGSLRLRALDCGVLNINCHYFKFTSNDHSYNKGLTWFEAKEIERAGGALGLSNPI